MENAIKKSKEKIKNHPFLKQEENTNDDLELSDPNAFSNDFEVLDNRKKIVKLMSRFWIFLNSLDFFAIIRFEFFGKKKFYFIVPREIFGSFEIFLEKKEPEIVFYFILYCNCFLFSI